MFRMRFFFSPPALAFRRSLVEQAVATLPVPPLGPRCIALVMDAALAFAASSSDSGGSVAAGENKPSGAFEPLLQLCLVLVAPTFGTAVPG